MGYDDDELCIDTAERAWDGDKLAPGGFASRRTCHGQGAGKAKRGTEVQPACKPKEFLVLCIS